MLELMFTFHAEKKRVKREGQVVVASSDRCHANTLYKYQTNIHQDHQERKKSVAQPTIVCKPLRKIKTKRVAKERISRN